MEMSVVIRLCDYHQNNISTNHGRGGQVEYCGDNRFHEHYSTFRGYNSLGCII